MLPQEPQLETNSYQTLGGVGTLAVSLLGVIWKYMRARKAAAPADARTALDSAVTGLKLAVVAAAGGIEALRAAVTTVELAVADIPEIRQRVSTHEIKISGLRTADVQIREDIKDVRREADELNERVAALEAQQRRRG